MKLRDKVAIVTGAASGMGKAIAEDYAKEGAKVVVSDLNFAGAQEVAAAINATGAQAIAVQTNVASEEDLEKLFKETKKAFGKLDILVNNAGIMDGIEPIGEISNERWEKVFAVNTFGVMVAMRLAVNIFLEQGHGVIINNISIGGLYGGRAGAAYTASKHAVVGLTKNTAYMYAQKNVRCNAIAPGGIETNIGSTMTDLSKFGFERQGLGIANNPRMGKSEEVSPLAVFLASDDASYINGQIIVTDGGWTAY